jgi:hydroxymethylbilane synthase
LIRIGTRGSALALAQAGYVAERLSAQTEIVTLTTSGDRGLAVGDKSRWVSELERALMAEEIDLAVHSAKDVPTQDVEGLELVAFTERADPRDALCGGASLASLASGARVGTSSLRRAAQLRALRPDLEVLPLRGNVDTRLRKLGDNEVDALVIALAGLERLGRRDAAGGVLDELVPAAGQGALALQARTGSLPADVLASVSDTDATACVKAERDVVRLLEASCNTPVGVFAQGVGDGQLELVAWVGLPDGSAWIRDALQGPADGVGAAVAERLLSAGADDLLRRAEQAAPA